MLRCSCISSSAPQRWAFEGGRIPGRKYHVVGTPILGRKLICRGRRSALQPAGPCWCSGSAASAPEGGCPAARTLWESAPGAHWSPAEQMPCTFHAGHEPLIIELHANPSFAHPLGLPACQEKQYCCGHQLPMDGANGHCKLASSSRFTCTALNCCRVQFQTACNLLSMKRGCNEKSLQSPDGLPGGVMVMHRPGHDCQQRRQQQPSAYRSLTMHQEMRC